MKEITINNRYQYSGKAYEDAKEIQDWAAVGNDVWFKFKNGARVGTIAKIVDPKHLFSGGQYSQSLPNSFEVLLGNGKTVKVGVKSYNNDLLFLLDYDGGHVDVFQKGLAPKDKPTRTGQPDMLGNLIDVGDWVIYQPRGRGNKPGLGKLNRLSVAGGAWVMAPNRYGEMVEVRTEGVSTLIKVNMTPELHTTYVLCESLQDLRTKLIIDLDID